MPVKTTVAIVGAANEIGDVFAKRLAQHHYRLLLVSNGKDQFTELAKEIKRSNPAADIDIAHCEKDGCWEADIIMLSVPPSTLKQIAERIKEVATQKTVINISVAINDTPFIISPVMELNKLLLHSRVVQVLISDNKKEGFIAGDDNEAINEASGIIKLAGFNPVIANNLSV